ncbi:hypothetical protein Tcan_05234 [Toxocara canis]|uniref:Uncharacterized protein n=1 Tax=Toxocara canis TaxID=6265 RepID=A0A0B2UYU8_TOXCA|nr:hypothetical protein Tcan_05234 [Toxocara canis]
MFDENDKLPPFGGYDDSFMNYTSNSFMHDSLPPFSFDSGSMFDRIFPLSPIERFNNTSLRKMSSGDIGGTPSVVRNIPIKIEGTDSIVRPRWETDEKGFPAQSMSRSVRQTSAPPPSLSCYRGPKR